MNYKLEDLIDIPLLQSLQEKLNVIYPFPSAIIDNDGKVLTAVAWQDICIKFHRKHPECEKECIKSDKYILEYLHKENSTISYSCPLGLVDNATPIIIDGKHLGNFFTSQFFLEKPDLEFFKKQAKKYGFNEKAYLEAVEKVPIWTKKKLAQYLDFIKGFIEIIAGLGLKNLKEIEIINKLKETEERQKAIINSTSDWIWEVDVNGKFTYCTEKVEQILGYKTEEILGKTLFDFMPENEKEKVGAIFQEIVETKSPILDLENWNLHKDGHKVCLLTNGFPVLDENGKIIGYRGANKDITIRKLTEESLLKSEEKFRTITESSPDAIFMVNMDGNYVYANQFAANLLGYTKDEILKLNIKNLGEQDVLGHRFQKLIKDKKIFTEMKLKRKNGTLLDIDLNAVVLPNGLIYASCRDLTKRKNSEKLLHESNKEKSTLLKSMINAFVIFESVFDKNNKFISYRFQYINDAYEQITGVKNEEVKGKTVHEVWPETEDEWIKRYGEVAVSGKSQSFELYHDPTKKLYNCNVYRPFDTSERFCVIFEDITDSKLAEKTLKESEKRFKDLIEMLPVAVFEMNPEFIITYANQYAFDLFGYNEDDLTKGLSGFDMLAPEEKERILANFALRLKGEHPGVIEYKGLKKDGTKLTVYFHANTIYTDGKLIGIRGVIVDITEQKKAQDELKLSENKLKYIIENSTNMFYSHTSNHEITFVSPQVREVLGYEPNEVMQDWTELVTDNPINEEGFKLTEKALKTGQRQPVYELELQRKDGRKIIVEVRESPVIENAKVTAIVGSLVDITVQKKAEWALKESEERYRNVVNVSPDAIIIHCEGKIIFVNQATVKMFGASSVDDLLGKSAIEFVHPDDREIAINRITEMFKTGNPAPLVEERMIKFDGTVIYVELAAAFTTHNGKPASLVILRDTTERKNAELELQQSEERFKRLFDSLGDSVYVTKIGGADKGRILEVNSAAVRQTYYTRKELLQMNIIDDITIEGTSEISTTDWDEKLKKGQAVTTIEKKRRKDGSEFWTEVIVTPFEFKGEKASLSINHDITLRKLTSEKLKESETKFRSISEQISDVIFLTDSKGVINYISPAVINIFGYLPEEMEGKLFNVFLCKADIAKAMEAFKNSIISNTPTKNLELQMQRKNKKFFTGELNGRLYQSGDFIGAIGVIRDITERKKIEAELEEAYHKATESERLKSAFLANMSHEIRTPMNGILGFTSLLKEPGLSGDEQQEYIEIIEKSGDRMLNTINDIVDMSKIESGLMNLEMSETNINEQIENLYKFFKPEVENKGMRLLFTTALTSEEAIIKTDYEKFYAILTNLIKNAIKYSHKGSIEFGYNLKPGTEQPVPSPVTLSGVEVSKESRSAILEFYIKDTGIGIPENKLEAVFERFIQADISKKRAYEGSGLGLSITKAYVEMLGGKIWVESKEGVGSTFYFTIPYNTDKKEITIAIEAESIETKAKVINENQEKKLIILIAEDEEFADRHLSILLKNIGKEILFAKNGVEALELFQKNPGIDLILMDVKMPILNGYEATKKIREINKNVIIIAQTAYALEGDREKAIEAGCDDYITKPIDKDELLEKIKKLVKFE